MKTAKHATPGNLAFKTASFAPGRGSAFTRSVIGPAIAVAAFLGAMQCVGYSQNVLVNSSFENVQLNASPYNIAYNASSNPNGFTDNYLPNGTIRSYLESADNIGWQTTATDNKIELWRNGQTVLADTTAPLGEQWAELNATQPSTLFQDVTISSVGTVDLGFYHRGRLGPDTLGVRITYLGVDNTFGTGDDSQVFYKEYTTGNSSWAFYNELDQFTSVADGRYRFAYTAVSSTAGPSGGAGALSFGNFIDSTTFGVNAIVPEPSSAMLGLLAASLLMCRRR